MATETGPDLSGAVAAVEALMDDTCLLTRDEAGVDDAVLDQETGELVDPPPSAKYEGRCSIKAPKGLANAPTEQGGIYYTQGTYMLGLPLTELAANPDAEPRIGDFLLVTSSRRDPGLVGKKFRLIDVYYGTMATKRSCALEYRG